MSTVPRAWSFAIASAVVLLQAGAARATTPASASPAPATPVHKTSPYHSQAMTGSAMNYYMAQWGIDRLKVSYTASGNLIKFTYRVVDARLATALGDEKATPYLYGQRSHALLQVPTMDKVGTLRQVGAQKAGMEYWMVFSNKGNLVRRGDRVSVLIGVFHADGLLVE
jgi:hypothetical protein